MSAEINTAYPINFMISDAAIAAIEQMTANAEREFGAGLWPSIMWVHLAGQSPDSGAVGIGFHEKDRIDGAQLSQVRDFRFVYGVVDRNKQRFEGKTLDTRDGYLVLVDQ